MDWSKLHERVCVQWLINFSNAHKKLTTIDLTCDRTLCKTSSEYPPLVSSDFLAFHVTFRVGSSSLSPSSSTVEENMCKVRSMDGVGRREFQLTIWFAQLLSQKFFLLFNLSETFLPQSFNLTRHKERLIAEPSFLPCSNGRPLTSFCISFAASLSSSTFCTWPLSSLSSSSTLNTYSVSLSSRMQSYSIAVLFLTASAYSLSSFFFWHPAPDVWPLPSALPSATCHRQPTVYIYEDTLLISSHFSHLHLDVLAWHAHTSYGTCRMSNSLSNLCNYDLSSCICEDVVSFRQSLEAVGRRWVIWVLVGMILQSFLPISSGNLRRVLKNS